MGGHHLAVSQLRLDMQRDGGSAPAARKSANSQDNSRSEEHTSELQSPDHLVCRLLLEKKNQTPENRSAKQLGIFGHAIRHRSDDPHRRNCHEPSRTQRRPRTPPITWRSLHMAACTPAE